MAEKTKTAGVAEVVEQPKENNKTKSKLKIGTVIITILMVAAIILGGWILAVKYNVAGLGDKMAPIYSKDQILSMILPKEKLTLDEDPKNMSIWQLESGYLDLLQTKKQLTAEIEAKNKEIETLTFYKNELDSSKGELSDQNKDIVAQKKSIDDMKKYLEEQRKKLDQDIQKFNVMVANKDATGFKSYYEKLDKDTAAKVYAEVIKAQKDDTETLKYIKMIESMDQSKSAKMLEQMGMSNLDLVVNILSKMKGDTSAQIISSMSPDFAALVADRMASKYNIYNSK